MKLLVVVCLALCASGIAGDVSNAEKQQTINRLLYKPTEPIPDEYDELKSISSSFNPVEDKSQYSDDGAAAEKLFNEADTHHLLEKHHLFSLFDDRQRAEALMLFDVLIHCNDFECFTNNAAYFREQMNEGEFVYALYVGVIHSPHTQHVVLPPLYEITPHLFTSSEIINQAYISQMKGEAGQFVMNFTGSQKNPEQRVAYFGEDIGLNNHHVSWHMDYPFWWEDSYGYHLDRKGELFFYVHHQLTARFDSERLSNHLGMVEELAWDKPVKEGFAPHTSYRYGGEFPSRPDNKYFEDVDGIVKVRELLAMENRIRDAIAHGYITDRQGKIIHLTSENGMNILGDIIESSMYSPNPEYYGSLHNLAHVMLGRQADPHNKFNMPPGVMEHFETATRDPSFFRLHKYMNNIFKDFADSLPPYTAEDLAFPGIKVSSVDVSPLKTYFDEFKFDLGMAVDSSSEGDDVPLSAVVSRLDHDVFTIDIDVENNGDERVGTIRVFLCPANDEHGIYYSFNNGRWNCIEMDKFFHKLAPGYNKISRISSDSSVTIPDIPSYSELVSKADKAVAEGEELDLSEYERNCGIPDRLLLPKGNEEGLAFWLSVFVSDASEDSDLEHPEESDLGGTHSHCGVHGEKYPDKKPLLYPFNRRIPDDRTFMKSDSFNGKLVKVYHEDRH